VGHVCCARPILDAHILFRQAITDCSQLALEIMHGRTMQTGLRGRKFGVAPLQLGGIIPRPQIARVKASILRCVPHLGRQPKDDGGFTADDPETDFGMIPSRPTGNRTLLRMSPR